MTGGQNQCCTSFSVYVGSSTEQTVAKSSASKSICAVTRSFLFSGGKRHCGVGGGSGGRAPWTSSPRAEAPGVVLERFISNSRHCRFHPDVFWQVFFTMCPRCSQSHTISLFARRQINWILSHLLKAQRARAAGVATS